MSSSQRGGRCEPLSGIISSFKSPPLSFASCQGSQLLCKSLLHKNIEQLANNILQRGCSGDQWESCRFKSKVVWSLLASFGISVSFLGSLLTLHMNLSNIGRGAFPTTDLPGGEAGGGKRHFLRVAADIASLRPFGESGLLRNAVILSATVWLIHQIYRFATSLPDKLMLPHPTPLPRHECLVNVTRMGHLGAL